MGMHQMGTIGSGMHRVTTTWHNHATPHTPQLQENHNLTTQQFPSDAVLVIANGPVGNSMLDGTLGLR